MKQKGSWPTKANGTNKSIKKTQAFDYYLVFGPILITGKRSFNYVVFHFVVWFFDSFHFLIFIYLLVFLPKY